MIGACFVMLKENLLNIFSCTISLLGVFGVPVLVRKVFHGLSKEFN